MIELILTVCTLASPERCSETRLHFVSQETPAECAMDAPPFIAQWSWEHPGVRIARWRCAYPGAEGAKI